MLRAYLSYLLRARTAQHLHSPFIYRLYTQVIKGRKQYYAFRPLEGLRKQLLKDKRRLAIQDYGAGPRRGSPSSERTVRHIARRSLASPRKAQLLFRLVNHFQPSTILELGTSLGLSTLYMAKASQQAHIFTLEGSANIARLAAQNFEHLPADQVTLVVGNIDECLSPTLSRIDRLDFAYLDANHRYTPTLNYFEQCLEKVHEESVFVLDDINWSAEMRQAWEAIKQHPRVRQSIDLFHVGLVFFREEQAVQHFVLRW